MWVIVVEVVTMTVSGVVVLVRSHVLLLLLLLLVGYRGWWAKLGRRGAQEGSGGLCSIGGEVELREDIVGILGGGGGLWLLYIGGRGEVVHSTVAVFLWEVVARGLLEGRLLYRGFVVMLGGG